MVEFTEAQKRALELVQLELFFGEKPHRVKSEEKRVGFQRLSPDAILPVRAHATDSGFDLTALEDVIIRPGETVVVKTGIAAQLPQGYEAQVRPRSGVTSRTKLRVQLGTIDNGYSGDIGVIVDNIAEDACGNEMQYLTSINGVDYRQPGTGLYPTETYQIRKGDRIAQLVVAPVFLGGSYEVVAEIRSERGDNGFGSTGVTSEGGETI